MVGSFRFLSGDQLYLVAEDYDGRIMIEPRFLRKAKSGDATAQALLAERFWNGWGIPGNNQQAALWAKKSFDQGNSFGICVFAALTDTGSGVPQDSTMALKYWQRAADAGEGWAFAALGEKYLWGRGVIKDYVIAVPLLQQAVDKGHHGAMVSLGRCYENGWGVGVDLNRAEELYQKATENPDCKDARDRLEKVRKLIAENSSQHSNQP